MDTIEGSARPQTPMKIVLCTPFYEVKAYSPYIPCLLDAVRILQELGIPWDFWELSGDSYVDRAKNALANRFMEHTDFTHIMMIDSDLTWNIEGFMRVIKAALMGAEVVGGAYPNKNNWTSFGASPMMENGRPIIREEGGIRLIQMSGIPGGFIIYSRKAFERTKSNVNTYLDEGSSGALFEYFRVHVEDTRASREGQFEEGVRRSFEQAMEDLSRFSGTNKEHALLEMFRCNIEDGKVRIGEDIYFQRRYREAGGTVWCEPNISFRHIGMHAWSGNYAKWLEKYDSEEPRLSAEDRKVHIIMAFSRHHLAQTLVDLYRPMNVVLHPMIFKDEAMFPIREGWIRPFVASVDRKDAGSLISLTNMFIENAKIEDDHYYCTMTDDDMYDPGVVDRLRELDNDVVVVSMKRGDNLVPGSPYNTMTLVAHPNNMKIGGVGGEQIAIKGRIFKTLKFDEEDPCADGSMAVYLKDNFKVRYEPDLFVLFNYLEPGRWNT